VHIIKTSALVGVFTNKTRVPGIYAEPAGQTIIPVEFHVRTMPTAIHRLHGGRHFGLLVKNTNKGGSKTSPKKIKNNKEKLEVGQ